MLKKIPGIPSHWETSAVSNSISEHFWTAVSTTGCQTVLFSTDIMNDVTNADISNLWGSAADGSKIPNRSKLQPKLQQ